MSWDVTFSTADNKMGTKATVRETFLSACEKILDTTIQRNGPTEVLIDDSFRYEILFIGSKHATESLCLAFKFQDGDPTLDDSHPVWPFIHQIIEYTGWQAEDTHTGKQITGREG